MICAALKAGNYPNESTWKNKRHEKVKKKYDRIIWYGS